MSKKWRCAVVGVGTVGGWHTSVIPKLKDAELVAVCDLEPQKVREKFAKTGQEHVPVYESQKEMLDKHDVNVVHVCTPSGDHMTPVITALEAGRDVICEKPMEIQLDRIDRMIETAQKKNRRLAGIFQTRWNDSNRALKQAADEGRFGTISFAGCYTEWYRTDQYYRDGGWRGTWKLDGGGAIMNQSVHATDVLQWIAGPVKSVSAYAASRIHPEIEVEDTLSCALQFENGAFGSIVGTTAMYPGRPVRHEIGGSNGSAVVEGTLKFYKFRDERPDDAALLERLSRSESAGGGTSATDVAMDMHVRNIAAIFDAWSQGRDAETAGPEARKAVAIILAMYESARKGGASVKVG